MINKYGRNIETEIFTKHPYPEYRPQKSGNYMAYLAAWGWSTRFYNGEKFEHADEYIIAWAYVPKPYGGAG